MGYGEAVARSDGIVGRRAIISGIRFIEKLTDFSRLHASHRCALIETQLKSPSFDSGWPKFLI